jgi:tetratricopeptide (TPR) repeat protein
VNLDPELEASLEFVLGRAADGSLEQSRQHYERSLALWQQQQRSQKENFESDNESENIPPLTPPYQGRDRGGQNPKPLERQGCLLYCLGLWWYTDAQRHPGRYNQAYGRAKDYFQQCVEVFEQAERPELVAKFINALGDVLQRLQQWDELEAVAKKALALHQTYPDSFRLARAYGFLAQVALAKSDWTEAQQSAQQALSLLSSACPIPLTSVSSEESIHLDWECSYHQGWYLLSLSRAQQGLGQFQEAIKTLETARERTKAQYDPQLYIRILEELRNGYFKQGRYLTAFQVKQEQRSIEHQYGFRAFIGAGRLQPKQQVINPALAPIEQSKYRTVSQEIVASGRQQDVNRLVERIGRHDHKFTVIYGPSGVGKSSILQAGLILALKQKPIGTHDVLPVLQRAYTNWIRILGQSLVEGLEEARSISLSETLNSTAAILEQLGKNAEYNLLSVLIFDQF